MKLGEKALSSTQFRASIMKQVVLLLQAWKLKKAKGQLLVVGVKKQM